MTIILYLVRNGSLLQVKKLYRTCILALLNNRIAQTQINIFQKGHMMTKLPAPDWVKPPRAVRRSTTATHHGDTRCDPYCWLKDKSYPDVTEPHIVEYLEAENAYYESVMQKGEKTTLAIFEEIKARIPASETGVPWRDGAYEYRWAFEEKAQYRTWYYRPARGDLFNGDGYVITDIDDSWGILFNEEQAAKDLDYFKLSALSVSRCGRYLAYSVDTDGGERFTVYVRDIKTGQEIATPITNTSGEIIWSADSQTLFYTVVSKEWRPYKVCAYDVVNQSHCDILIENDTSFFIHIGATSDQQYLTIRSADHVTSEYHVVALRNPDKAPALIKARRAGHDYYVDHGGDSFVFRSNKDHKNFSIYTASDIRAPWEIKFAGSDQRYIRGVQTFKNRMIIQERINGLDQIAIYDLIKDMYEYIRFPERAYEALIGHNPMYQQGHVRVTYTSLVTPASVFDYDFTSKQLVLRKQQDIPSGYNASDYETERIMVPASDGASVPVSLVYKKGWQKHQDSPLHLYGYGAYGLGISPAFSVARLSLLDRGFAYAIAHIRGGDELGYQWYEDGKLEKRENTFNDFIDVAQYFISEGYSTKRNLSISGGSAGGELIGAVVNQAPNLFAAAILHVPFVDVLNTMLDTSLPLTPIEWPEWGNPIADKKAYQHIKSYCPYTNIKAQDYPPMMVTGGLNDPRVTYWEPAKWTAKLRHTKTDHNLLIMKINMGAGHGGKSGRFERYYEIAEEYYFLLLAHSILINE